LNPIIALFFLALCANAGVSGATNSPAHNFRRDTLQYVGPELDEPDATNVTEVLIAWFAPFDPKHELGGGLWTAANMALEEANRAGGFRGLPFRLLPHWSENPWTGGVGPLVHLVYEQPVWAILGSLDGAGTHLAEQVVVQARLTLLSPVSTDKSVNLAGVPWMFSCAPHDGQIAPLLADAVLAAERAGQGSLALISATDHDSRAAQKELLKAFKARQRLPDFEFECAPGTPELAKPLEAIKQASPRIVVVVGNALDSATMVRAIRKACPGCELFGTHTMGQTAFLRHAGPAAEGLRFPLLFSPQNVAVPQKTAPGASFSTLNSQLSTLSFSTNSQLSTFPQHFTARQGEAPDYLAAYAYDATSLLIDAIRRSGLNRARIREALARTEWQGVTGSFHWDGVGQNTRSAKLMGVIRNGRVMAAP
jgi:ABC-type branched-subunit amino acid transport system substrate-binding protein